MIKLKTEHVQHSKKLAVIGFIQWGVIACLVIGIILFSEIDGNESEVLSGIITWSATLAGVAVTGYMGNSSIEKYADRKFTLTKSISENDGTLSNG